MFRALAAATILVWTTGCVTARNYAHPKARITPGTAYTLAPDHTEIGASVLGLSTTDLGASIGVRHGFGRHWQVGANLAHAMLGVATVHGKVNAVEYRHFAFGVDAGLLYARPSLIWVLPDKIKDPIDRVNLVTIPMTARFSFPVNRWFSAHVGLGYTHASVFGPIESGDTLIQAGLGARRLHANPILHFFAGRRVALIAGANVPLYTVAREDVTARSEIQPGVVLGAVSSEWVRIPIKRAARYNAGIEVRFGRVRYTHLRLLVSRGILSQAGIAPVVVPSFRAYWRF